MLRIVSLLDLSLLYKILTICNIHLVYPAFHCAVIISHSQLAESRETCGPHPNLESFVFFQVRRRMVFGVTVRPLFLPIRWNGNLFQFILGRAIQGFVALPSNTFVCHMVRLVSIAVTLNIDKHGTFEGIVEPRVGNETTGIIRFSVAI